MFLPISAVPDAHDSDRQTHTHTHRVPLFVAGTLIVLNKYLGFVNAGFHLLSFPNKSALILR